MSDFLRLIGDWLTFLWPFRIVAAWEEGVQLVFGRYWRTSGPGWYLTCPFFMDMHVVNVVPGMIVTPRLDITLLDGTMVSLVASAWHRVVDARKAVTEVEEFETTSNELLQAVIADRIARAKPDRLEPENRAALLRSLTEWVATEAAEYGVEVTKVRFSTFVLRARTYRLIGEH